MCNDDCDLKCVPRYKPNLELFDKIVLGCTFVVMGCAVVLMIIGMFYPERLICN